LLLLHVNVAVICDGAYEKQWWLVLVLLGTCLHPAHQ
jgi:hypothetical protein